MSDARSDAIPDQTVLCLLLIFLVVAYESSCGSDVLHTPSWIATGTSDDDAFGLVPDPFPPFYVPALDITKVLS